MRQVVLNRPNEIHIDEVNPCASVQYSYRDNVDNVRILIRDVSDGSPYFWRYTDCVLLGCADGDGHNSLTGAIRHAINHGFQVYQSDTLLEAINA